MRKFLKLGLIIALSALILQGCSNNYSPADTNKITVVCTNFAAYDLTKNVVGSAGEVIMLLKPGEESHSFEPTPKQIIEISNAALFVFGGGPSDSWADSIFKSAQNPPKAVRMLELSSKLYEQQDNIIEGHDHDHAGHSHEYDEHVWTSPKNAIKIVKGILSALLEADSENAAVYSQNASEYIQKLEKLDDDFARMVKGAKRKTVVFCDKFPFLYLVKEYGLEYIAAFPGCYEGAQPNAKTVANLIDTVKAENIPAVFYIELSNMQMANTVAADTGAAPLLLHSCHGVTKAEFDNNQSYLSLMRQNLLNLKEALY